VNYLVLTQTSKLNTTLLLVISPRATDRGFGVMDTIKILNSLGVRVILLTGPSFDIRMNPSYEIIQYKIQSKILSRGSFGPMTGIMLFLIEQILLAKSILKLRHKIDGVLFSHILAPFPLVIARILKKKAIVYAGGSPYLTALSHRKVGAALLVLFLETLMYNSSNTIVLISKKLRDAPILSKYQSKTLVAPIRLLDEEFLKKFRYENYLDRKNIVGFVGRLSEEKGILEFLRSIPLVLEQYSDVQFLIVGEGASKELLLLEKQLLKMSSCVSFVGWVDHVESYLEKMKLLVLPSKTEGVPSVVLEAISCGTVILASPVGGVPEIIQDKETGFLLKSTDPKNIASMIVKLLKEPELLSNVSKKGHDMIICKYSVLNTLNAWRTALENSFLA